jgi:pimeloyl-ACP methyl ester carboxylesterase
VFVFLLATAAMGWAAVPATALHLGATGCGGDCDGDGAVAINELIAMVRIALDPARIQDCTPGDRDGDSLISIAELVGAVGHALTACPTPRIELTACEIALPPGEDPADVTCGDLVVPENRQQPNGRTIRVAFAVVNASGPDPASDPLVFLPGGPGELELDFVEIDVPNWFAAIHPTRDLVFLDLRGTGRSRPSLDCPEWPAAWQAALAVRQTAAEDAATLNEAMRTCHDRLVGEGIDLAAYTSAASALDVRDLMTLLGYPSWNVYGLSYGTRLALTAMRDAPQGIRSVVLNSTLPVQANQIADFPASVQRSLDLLFASCAGDAGCAGLYPDFEQTLFDLVERLNGDPVTLRGTNPATGAPLTFVVTGDRLLVFLSNWLYDRNLLGRIPLVITFAARGNYGLLSAFVVHPVATYRAWGMFHAVMCGEEAPFITQEILNAATAGVREDLKRALLTVDGQQWLDVCEFWGSPPPPALENEPVVSDIPTLLLTGEYDPGTPPAYAELATETLPHSYLFELRGYSHNQFGSGCSDQLTTAFLNDPTSPPDASCVDALPPLRFFGTAEAAAIAPIPTVTRRLPTIP